MQHKYSKETLYHFNCGMCSKWWSIGDWTPSALLTCPHCSTRANTEELTNV